MAQILSIMCDNASNNDTMIEALKDHLEIFPGESHCTWCFDHIVNLVAKSIIQQFDVPKAKGNESFDDVLRELMVLAEDLDKEELATREGEHSKSKGDEDDTDGWVDEREEMSESERKELDDNIQPIRRVLVKVSVKGFTPLCLTWAALVGDGLVATSLQIPPEVWANEVRLRRFGMSWNEPRSY